MHGIPWVGWRMVQPATVCLIVILAGYPTFGAEAPSSKPLNICEIFRDLLSHTGKMLRVRGELVPHHGGWILTAPERCPKQFTVGDKAWPTVLSVEVAGSILLDPPAAFEPDRTAVKRLTDLIVSLRQGKPYYVDPRATITATFTGELRTRKIEVEMLGSVPYKYHYGPGYGPLLGSDRAQAPAELVIKAVEDIVVTQK